MNFHEATEAYEDWLRRQLRHAGLEMDEAALDSKHAEMKTRPLPLLRAAFYRWAQTWRELEPELRDAPHVLAVGDLHIENFGTWRDDEGRLVWGVNDFDEAYPLPYTNDLIRLATSIRLAWDKETLRPRRFDVWCDCILDGYATTLAAGRAKANPFVLSEENAWLRDVAVKEARDPGEFWEKLDRSPKAAEADTRASKRVEGGAERLHKTWVPDSAHEAVLPLLPQGVNRPEWRRRVSGLGSRGRPRYVTLAHWQGGRIAREAKALVPSAAVWVLGTSGRRIYFDDIVQGAVRCPDPYLVRSGSWLVRRLAPDCDKLSLDKIPEDLTEDFLRAMGRETAHIHLARKRAVPFVLRHLQGLPPNWLPQAAEERAKQVKRDWREWRDG